MTVHGTALVIGTTGIFIRGRSGAGKSSLALDLLDAAADRRIFARLVADDRVVLGVAHGRVLARPVEALAGLAERRGYGLLRLDSEPAAVVRLIVDLVAADQLDRMPESAMESLVSDSLPLPRVRVPERAREAVKIVQAAICDAEKVRRSAK